LVDCAVAASNFRNARRFLIGVRNETPSIVAVRVSNPDYRISVAAGADRGSLKARRKIALRLLMLLLDLRVFGSRQI
jgi:hypothetical protein